MTDLNPAMAWDRLAPPERGGDVARRVPLQVESLRRLEVEELLVRDDDLPVAGVASGECQGRRCVAPTAARLDQQPGDRGARITPRPPLVPVPASILAAFAEPEPVP